MTTTSVSYTQKQVNSLTSHIKANFLVDSLRVYNRGLTTFLSSGKRFSILYAGEDISFVSSVDSNGFIAAIVETISLATICE